MILYNLNKNHEIFGKGYRKPKPEKKNFIAGIMIKDDDGFFDGLPDCKMRRRGFIPGVSRAVKLEH